MNEVQTQKNALASFRQAVKSREAQIWESRAEYLKTEQPRYFEKAMLYIAQQESLVQLIGTQEGRTSIMSCLISACQLGLEFGGMYPQAYIVPFKQKCSDGKYHKVGTLIPSAVGYKTIAMTEPRVIMDAFTRCVYSNEDCRIDFSSGRVHHEFDVIKHGGNKGDFLGVYATVYTMDDLQVPLYMSKKDIEAVRNSTPTYKAGYKSDAWEQHFEAMAQKTVMKKALKPFVTTKSALASLYQRDGENANHTINLTEDQAQEYREQPIEDRVLSGMGEEPPEVREEPPIVAKEKQIPPESAGEHTNQKPSGKAEDQKPIF